MIGNKVVLTYKRKHASSHFDHAHVNDGNASSKSSRRISKSAAFNEALDGDDKRCFKCHVNNSNGMVLDCSSCSKTSECNDPSSESTTQGRWQCAACVEQHGASCVEQHDNAGELAQQQVHESDKSKKFESVQGLEKGLTEHSHSSSPIREVSVKDAAQSKDSDVAFVDSNSALTNGIPHNTGSSGFPSLDLDIAARSNHVPIDSTEGKCISLCREEYISETFISGEKGLPFEEKSETLSQRKVNKESLGTPLRTFCRRAKRIKGVSEAEVHDHSKVASREGSASEQKMLDAIYKSEGPSDQSRDLPLLGKDNLESNQTSLSPNGEDVAKKLQDGSHGPRPGGFVENERDWTKVSAVHCTDRSNFTIKEGELVLEDRPIEVQSNCCSNDCMKDSSEVNQKDRQFKLPKTDTLTGDVPAIGFIDALKKPVIRSMSNEFLKADDSLSNLCRSDGLRPDINVCELAPNRTTADCLYETRKKPMDDASHESLFDPRGSDRSGKEFEPLETMDRREKRVICTTPQADISRRLAFNEDDTLCQMSMNSSLPDPAVPQMQNFLRENKSLTPSPQKGNFVRDMGSSILESQWGTQATRTVCMDFLGSVRIEQESIVDPIKNFRSVSPISSLKGTGYVHDVQHPWQASDSNSSIFRHKQILDDIITSSRMLNKRHDYYFANYKRYPGVWSDEELDSLWIGVRRHGRGNWNAMLGDPKLHFSGWRIADDLAERWDMEQSRLLATPFVHPMRSLEADHSPSSIMHNRLLSNSAVDSSYRCYLPDFQNSRNEIGLSLGGVYLKKEGKNTNRITGQLSDFTVHPLAANGSLGAGSSYSYRGHHKHPLYTDSGTTHQRPGKSQDRYDFGLSMLEQNSVERLSSSGHQVAAFTGSTTMPHWLKDVLGTPATPSEQALLSGVSTFEHSTVSHSGDQRVIPAFSYPSEQSALLKDARRGILKRRGTHRSNASVVGLSTLKSAESKVSDATILDLNRSSLEGVDQNNLVILDGDASSEETISDDQSGRC